MSQVYSLKSGQKFRISFDIQNLDHWHSEQVWYLDPNCIHSIQIIKLQVKLFALFIIVLFRVTLSDQNFESHYYFAGWL